MKKLLFLMVVFLVFSCKDKDALRKEEAEKAAVKTEQIFKEINNNWKFKTADFTEEAYSVVQEWSEWNSFYNELLQKPQTDIGAFQRKTKTLVSQSEALESTIPEVFNTTQIQSRIAVMVTKLKMLKIYINLNDVPAKDVIRTVNEINVEVESVVSRMKTILEKNKILKEEGELEMLEQLKATQQPTLP